MVQIILKIILFLIRQIILRIRGTVDAHLMADQVVEHHLKLALIKLQPPEGLSHLLPADTISLVLRLLPYLLQGPCKKNLSVHKNPKTS